MTITITDNDKDPPYTAEAPVYSRSTHTQQKPGAAARKPRALVIIIMAREAAPMQAARRSSLSSVDGIGLRQYGHLILLFPYCMSDK